MAKEFSFEEATAPPAKAATPKEFSFEEAVGAKPKATQVASDAEYDFGDAMGTGSSEIMAVAKPKKKSVMEGMDMPAPAVTEDRYVVNPQFTNAVQAQLNSMPAEKRGAALEKMAKRPDVYGRAARAIAGRYEAADQVVSPTVSKLTDLRLEQQTQRFIDQGVNPDVAEGIARNQALSGQARPDLDQMRETPEEVQAGMDLAYDPKLHGIDATVRAVQRMGWKTAVALGQAGGGMQVFAGDLLGLDTSDKRDTLKKMSSFTQAMGDPSLKPLSVLESAVTSIGQQLPAMVFGAVTGSEPLVLASMFANSFGQNYEEGRRDKLDFADSTARAAANASLEIIGEKLGLKQQIGAIKTAMKGVPTDQLANFIAITLKKEVPGELLTYAGQYAVDMGYGMKPEASIQNFVQGAIDTMLTTVAQGGIMAGGRKALTAMAGRGGAKSEIAKPETIQSAEELAKSKGFLVPTPTKTEANKEFSFEEAIKPAEEPAAPIEDVKTISERLQAQGIPQHIANAIAEKEVQTNEPAQNETGGTTNVVEPISTPSGEGVEMAGQPSAEPATEGVGVTEPSGVVPTRPDVTGTDTGEGAQQAALAAEEELDKKSAAETQSLPFEELRAKTKEGASAPGKIYTVTYDDTDVDLEGNKLSTRVSTQYKIVRMDGGWTVVSSVEGNDPVLLPPSRAAANTDEQLVAQRNNKSSFASNTIVTPAESTPPKTDTTSEAAYAERIKDDPSAPAYNDTDARIKRVADRYEQAGDAVMARMVRGVPEQRRPSYEETAQLEKDQDQIFADKDKEQAFQTKKAKVESIARSNASTAFDQAGDYTSLQEAIDSYEINMGDTLVEEGFRNDPDYDDLVRAANRAFTAEVNRQKGTTSGSQTSKAKQTTQEGQAASGAGTGKGKRGPKPVQQTHVVVENSSGKFDHIDNGEVAATYDNKKQAIAAVNLAKAKDRGDAARVAKFQAELDKALTSKGRGRPPSEKTEAGTVELNKEEREELAELESALKRYNSTADDSAAKNSALYISDAANDPNVPKAVRERAKQMLEDEVDPKDIPKIFRSSEANVDKADTGFNELTTGVQAISHIVKNGNIFQRLVAQRLRGYMAGVKLVVLEKGDKIPAEMEGARGLFEYTPSTKERTVYVRGSSFGDQQGINNVTVLHELLHAATAGRIFAGLKDGTKNLQLKKFVGEIESLMQRAREAYEEAELFGELPNDVMQMVNNTTDYDKKTGKVTIGVFEDPNEFLAYGMSSPTFQKFLMGIEGTQKEETAFSKFVRAILDLFGLGNGNFTALSDLVNITDKMLGEQAAPTTAQGKTALQQVTPKGPQTDVDKQKELNRAVAKATKAVATSRAGNQLGDAISNLAKWRDPRYLWGEIKGIYDSGSDSVRSAISNFYDSEALAYAGPGDIITGLKDAHEAIQKMAGSTQTYMRGVANMSEDVVKFFREHPKLRQPFEDLVQETTLAKYDPSDKKATIRSKKLDADYAALGEDGQKVYKQLRDYYKALNAVKQHLLEENINKLDLDPDARKKLLADVRLIFEQDKIDPYFPLARFGDFVLEVGKKGARASYRFETMIERDRAAREHAARKKRTIDELRQDGELVTSEDSGGSALRATIEGTSKLLKTAYAAIESANMADSKVKQNLKDTLYQAYLAAMPENSVRKMFIHRKGTPGFSSDILRTINTTGLKMSRALSKLEHSTDIRNALELANRELTRGNDKYKPFVKRMEELAADALQPNVQTDFERWTDTAAGYVAKISFLRNLTSWSSAMLQPMDIIMVGAPVLTGNHGPKAATALANRLKIANQYGVIETKADGSKRFRAPSIEYAKGLTPLQRRAVRDMVDMYGVTKDTLANAVFSRANKTAVKVDSKAYEMGKTAVNNLVLGGLMHHGERLSREVISLTSFDLYMAELEKASPGNPMNYHEAVKLAVRETHEALGNYSESNRPLIMRGGLGKLVTMYKFFPLVRTKLLAVNFFRMLPLLNKEGKKAAATKFFGVLGTHLMFGGYVALPMFSLVMGALGLLWNKWQKDPDAPDDMKSIDYETWWRTEYIPKMLGNTKLSKLAEFGVINYLTGLDVASRISLNDMWFRDPQPGKTLKDTFLNWGQVLGGAAASTGLGMAQGLQLMSQGEYERGLEKAIPLGSLSKLLIAGRYATEGIQTPQGVQLAPKGKVPTSELVGQAIGFAPASLAEAQTRAFKATAAEKVVSAERSSIMTTLKDSFRKSMDFNRPLAQTERFDKIFNETLDKATEFSLRNPGSPILDAEISSLLNAEMKKIAETEMGGGVRETAKNYELVGPSSEAAVRALTPYYK